METKKIVRRPAELLSPASPLTEEAWGITETKVPTLSLGTSAGQAA
jgi:hypothetical protein